MKKILIILVLLNISISAKDDKTEFNIYNYPYDTKLIVKKLNDIKDKSVYSKKEIYNLIYIKSITNNQELLKIINKRLENKPRKKSYLESFINNGKIKTIDKFNRIYHYRKIRKIRNKNLRGIVFSIKAFYNRESNAKEYFFDKKIANNLFKNKYMFYYIQYKYLYMDSDYAIAYQYLNYIYENQSFNGIEEEMVNTCVNGAEKYFKNKDYDTAWIMSMEGLKIINKIDYNKNIDKRLKLKKLILESSKVILSTNKIKNKSLYIIQTTEKLLKETLNHE